MDWKRHGLSAITLGSFLLFALASGGPKGGGGDGGSGASASATAAKPNKPAPPKDVDTAALSTDLGCAGKKTDACRVLADFTAATEAPAIPASGKTAYFGTTWGAGAADAKSDPKRGWIVVHFEAGAAAAPKGVADGDVLAATGWVRPYTPDSDYEEGDASALLTLLKGGKKPGGFNAAGEAAKSGYFNQHTGGFLRSDTDPACKTDGASVAFISDAGKAVWVRKKDTRVLVVEYDAGTPIAHDKVSSKAWLSELWEVPQ